MVIPLLLGLVAMASTPPVTVGDIVEVTDLSGLTASPDGRWVAFRTEQPSISSNGDRISWYVVPIDGRRAPRRVGDGGGALFNAAGELQTEKPIWAPDSTSFYARALNGAAVQIWRYSVRGVARQVSHDPANIEAAALSPDRRSLVYEVGAPRAELDKAEQRADDDGVVVDSSVDMSQPLLRGAWADGHLASERLTGHWFNHGNLLWRTPDRTVRLAIGTPPAGSGAERRIAVERVYDDGRSQLVITMPDGRKQACSLPICKTEAQASAIATGNGHEILITTQDNARAQRLTLWDPDTGAAREVLRYGGLLNGGRDDGAPCAVAGGQAICVAATASGPPALVHLDLSQGRVKPVFDPNAALRIAITTPARRIDWTSALGTAFTGQLTLPEGPRPTAGFPLVINYYDCTGFLRGGLGDELPFLPLAHGGIATLCINEAHDPQGSHDDVWAYDQARAGIEAIVDQLVGQGLVDRSRIGMWGLSFGSEIVMMMAMRTHLLAAASISTGQLEQAFYWTNGVRGRDTPELMRKTWGVGDPDEDPEGWRRISPALNTARIQVPLLMQVPEQEARWSMELVSKLSRSTTPVEMVAYAHEAHQKQLPRHKASAYQRNLDWFRFWLQGFVPPERRDSDQFRRWASLVERWHGTKALDLAHP